MLKSCNRCGGIYYINIICNKGRVFKKKDTQANLGTNTNGNKSESKSKKGTNICVKFAGRIYSIPHMYITITK